MERARALKLLRLADPFDQKALDQAFEQRKKSIHPDFLADLDTAYDFLLMGLEEEEVSIPDAPPEAPPVQASPPPPLVEEPAPVVQVSEASPYSEKAITLPIIQAPIPPPIESIQEPKATPAAPIPEPPEEKPLYVPDPASLPVLKPKKKQCSNGTIIWMMIGLTPVLLLLLLIFLAITTQKNRPPKDIIATLISTDESLVFHKEINGNIVTNITHWAMKEKIPKHMTASGLMDSFKRNNHEETCKILKTIGANHKLKSLQSVEVIRVFMSPQGKEIGRYSIKEEDC